MTTSKFKISNKVLSVLLCLALVLSYLPSFTLTASAATKDCTADDCEGHYGLDGFCDVCGGYEPAVNIGTLDEGTVYQVSNAGQLYWFAKFINERTTRNKVHLWLANDITVNGYLLANGEVQLGNVDRIWTPIGNTYQKAFEGNIYGNGHTISGLYIPKSANCDSAGFIGYYQYGTIRDLSIVDSYFAPVTTDYVGAQAGSITARSAMAKIQQCYSNAVIDTELAAGGIVGYSKGDNIVNCGFSGTIKILANNGSAGGIIGTMDAVVDDAGQVILNETSINNCYSTCSLERADGVSDSDLGILVGTAMAGQITNFYYNSEVNSGLELFGYIPSFITSDNIIATWNPTYKNCVGKTSTEFSDGTVCGLIGYHLSHNGRCWLCSHVCESHTFENHHCKNCGTGYSYVESLDVEVPTEVFQGTSLQLSTTVSPDSASFKDVIWTVTSGTATLSDNSVTFTTAGTVTLKATIKNGTLSGNDFNETFTVKVYSSVEIDVSKINGAFYDDALQIYESDGQLAIKYNQNELVTVPIGTQIVLTGSNTGKQYAMVEVASCAKPVNLKIKNMTLSNSTYSALTVENGVTLNLELEGTNTLTATNTQEAIYVRDGATLNISGTGKLNATGSVGIGCSGYNASFGKVVINGGTVNASSNSEGAGIGAGYYGTGGTVIINGGTVTAKGGKYSAGIGGGEKAENINITINGGVVNAYGSNGNTLSNTGGAGIGAGYEGSGGSITISGGTVYAKGGVNSAGIGGGDGGTVDSITITGGTVTAEGHWLGAGIGGGRLNAVDSIVITGGNIKASSGTANAVGSGGNTSDVTPVTDCKDNNVSLVTVTLDGVSSKVAVTEVEGITYGLKDVKTLDTNKLYFYLPSGTAATSITAGGAKYFCKDNNSLTYYTGHDWSNKDGVCAHCGEICPHEGQTKTCTVCGKDLHEHNWTYEKDSDTKITATCTADGCDNPNGGYVTVSAPSSLTYTGSKIEAVVEDTLTTGAEVAVVYTGSTTDGYPVNAGEYTAKIKLGEKEIGVTYTVDAIDITGATVSAGNAVYTGNPHRPAVTVELDGQTLTENTDYVVAYADNTAVGTATVTVNGIGNYKGIAYGSFEIAYLTGAPDATVGGTKGGNDWYRSSVTLAAPAGYTISKTVDGAYGESLTYADEQNETVTYYLQDDASGEIAEKTVKLKIDKTAPAAKYQIGTNGWKQFINTITFGLFCKDYKTVEIDYSDNLSGATVKQYYIASEEATDTNSITWSDYTDKLNLNATGTYFIYMRVVDDAGHEVILNTEGIVIYEDSVQVTENVSATYEAGTDKSVTVELKGNTVSKIVNGNTALTIGTDYSVSTDGVITLTATYLDTLNAGEYTFTVSYNPQGVETDKVNMTTTFTVTVEKADGNVSNLSISSKTYDGNAVTAPTFDKLGDGTATIEYKKQGADDSTYTTTAPSAAGDYVVRVTVAASRNYKEASATAEFSISKATLTNVSVQQNGKLTYDGGNDLTPAVTENATALNGAKIYFLYGTDGNNYGEMPTFTDAGTYTVYYCTYTIDRNFYDVYDTFTVTIDKATVTEPTIASKSYNGTEQKADISDTDLYTVEKNNGGTAKGSYDVVLKLKDADNYKWATDTTGESATVTLQFVISAAENSWTTAPSINGWTYGQSANEPVFAAKYGAVKVTYTGKANDGSDYSSANAPTKAGSYTATFTVDGTQDYSGLSEQVNFTIAKKAVTVTANDAIKTYGDSDPALTYTHTELNGSDALFITVARASGENANTYTITASEAEGANPNYEITFKTGTFTIRKAILTVTAEDKSAAYGDAVPNYTVKYDGFKNGDDKDDLGGALAFYQTYKQFDDVGEYDIMPHGLTSDNYAFSYHFGKLTVSPKAITVTIQNATSIYGDALAELKATDNGIVNGDANVYSLATVATSASNVGKYAITGTALDSNYDVTFVNGEYEITKREITITVDAKNAVVNTALPTYTYKVEGLVGEDKLVTEPTLTCNANIAVIGEYEISASGADAGGNYSIKYVPAKLSVLTDNAVDAAAGYTEELKEYDPATVTSEDKAALDEILDEINTILDDENITDNGKKALEEVKEKVEDLIAEITDAADATDTENVGKVENVTPENVTPENKTDLEGAKADLEKALEDHGSNMTEDEKKAVEDEIKRIDDALEVIGNVEEVEELIGKLPENITKNDEDAIKAADDAYNALTDYEKSLVDEEAKKTLDDAKAALAELNKPADPNSPQTGDNSNLWLWVALLFVSGGATITLTVYDRKKRAAQK